MKKATIPSIITFIIALIAVATFFLPIVKATPETAAIIDQTTMMADSLNVNAPEVDEIKQMKEISLFDYVRVADKSSTNDSTAKMLFMAAGIIPALIALWAILRRPILTLLFDIALGGLFALISYAIEETYKMGVDFNWAIAHTLYIPLIAVIAIGAIWLMIAKRMDKKAARTRIAKLRNN